MHTWQTLPFHLRSLTQEPSEALLLLVEIFAGRKKLGLPEIPVFFFSVAGKHEGKRFFSSLFAGVRKAIGFFLRVRIAYEDNTVERFVEIGARDFWTPRFARRVTNGPQDSKKNSVFCLHYEGP